MADNTEWTPPRGEDEVQERLERIRQRQKPTPIDPEPATPVRASQAKKPKSLTLTLPSVPTPRPPKFHKVTKPLELILTGIVVLAIGFGGGWLGAAANRGNVTNVTQDKVELKGEAAVISDIAKNVGPSVVSVNVTSQSASTSSPFYDFFGGDGSNGGTQQDAGTGMILTSDGLIMTNRHVVPDGTTQVSVTLSDGTEFDNVQVVGKTADSSSLDVAFLKIQDTKGHKLTPVTLGDSSKMSVGSQVVAIGNALGQFQNTVTSGIISGFGRSIEAQSSDGSTSESLDGLLQTDAAINEGNSGGPLVNLDGEVIGMNTAIASDSENIGFAIPINDLAGVIQGVEKTGKLQLPYLGVLYVPVTSDVAANYNLKVSQGAYIPTVEQNGGQDTVMNGSPADQAGIQPGDVITNIDGTDITATTSITSVLGKHQVGDKVQITLNRNGDTKTVTVTLGAAPDSTASSS